MTRPCVGYLSLAPSVFSQSLEYVYQKSSSYQNLSRCLLLPARSSDACATPFCLRVVHALTSLDMHHRLRSVPDHICIIPASSHVSSHPGARSAHTCPVTSYFSLGPCCSSVRHALAHSGPTTLVGLNFVCVPADMAAVPAALAPPAPGATWADPDAWRNSPDLSQFQDPMHVLSVQPSRFASYFRRSDCPSHLRSCKMICDVMCDCVYVCCCGPLLARRARQGPNGPSRASTLDYCTLSHSNFGHSCTDQLFHAKVLYIFVGRCELMLAPRRQDVDSLLASGLITPERVWSPLPSGFHIGLRFKGIDGPRG